MISGRAFYQGKFGSKAPQQRYDAIRAEWLSSNRSPSFGLGSGDLLLSDLMVAYLQHCKSYYGRGQTSDWHRVKDALQVLASLYSEIEVTEFGPAQFKAVRQRMLDHHDWARSTINRNMKRIMCHWAF